MKGKVWLLLSVAVVVLLAGSLFDLYEFNMQGTRTSSASFNSSSGIGTSFTTQIVATTIINSTVFTSSTTALSSSTTTCTTIYPAGENWFYLRVVSDTNPTPIVDARVTATHQVTSPTCSGSPQTTTEIALGFTTTNAEWYPLDTSFSGPYSIVVTYSGHSYSLSSDGGRAESATCETLYIPSGRTNVTTTSEFVSTCPSTG